MTDTPYADLGPEIPIDGMPDLPPLKLTRIEELAQRNGLGEAVILIDAFGAPLTPIRLILNANPHTGEITRCAVCLRQGTGFVATSLECLPGNLRDIVRTILLDPRESG